MELGMVGLGKMGGNMTARLLEAGHRVVVVDKNEEAVARASQDGATAVSSAEELVEALARPRVVWIMVPAGDTTETVIGELAANLEESDIVVDGGNSNYKDTRRRARTLREAGLYLVDAGTSGGVWGRKEGYSLMVGGDEAAVDRLRPILESLAPAADRGWGRVGPSGAGHFVKMVHNGIEYGLMQAYAEGFEILRSKDELDLDLHRIAEIWRFGSVIRSWLLDLTSKALEADADLTSVRGWVADSGEGRWTVAEAMELDVPAPVITTSLIMRFVSRQDESFAAKLLAAMRGQFGGHDVKHTEERKEE